ncbi:MAG: hypothetical protein BMS9Abin07_1508 [Acidimicrobiia bacterium]|nr:MAG: hypothetical protein BMS9Abin07_1508 [Acidimicrobiia bacterium]
MIAALTMFLLLGIVSGPEAGDEPTDTYSAPGDGLGLTSNHPGPGPVSVPRPVTPRIPLPGVGLAGLGGLAAAAGLAATRDTGRRKEEEDGRTRRAGSGSVDPPAAGSIGLLVRKVYDGWLASLGSDAEVLMLDLRGDGKVAIRLGPADAEHVAILVPGTGADLAGTKLHVARARMLLDAAQRADPTSTVAVIHALPFDMPDDILTFPLSPDCACNPYLATVGAPELTRFVAGLDLEGADVTVIGYSYGSTVVGKALADEGLAAYVDRALFVGSPGVGVDRAVDLHLPPGSVFAAQAKGDVINNAPSMQPIVTGGLFGGPFGLVQGSLWTLWRARVGNRLTHGLDPTAPSFGAQYVETGEFGHSEYFDDLERLEHIANVVVGQAP